MYYGSNKKYLKPYRQDLRNNSSKTEDLLWKFIRKSRLGVKFRRQHSIENFILDFYAPILKLNIELDGEQHDGSIEKDRQRDVFLQSKGITVIRFSTLDCLKNIDSILIEIQKVIKGLEKTTPLSPPCRKGIPSGEKEGS